MTESLIPTSLWKAKLALLPGIATSIFLGVNPLLWALLFLQGLDCITGVMASKGTRRRITSTIAALGAKKKAMMWIYVAVARIMRFAMPDAFVLPFPLEAAVAGLFVWVEIVSISENGSKIGVPPPGPLKWAVVSFKGIIEKSTGQITGVAEVVAAQPPSDIADKRPPI